MRLSIVWTDLSLHAGALAVCGDGGEIGVCVHTIAFAQNHGTTRGATNSTKSTALR